MKGFNSKFIEEVKNKSDLVGVIGKYVRLEQRGKSFWGCCPFHHEKTPSFCVNSIEQFYHCFGCHKSGDVITFIQEIENLDFQDAVKFLAEKAGIAVPEVEYDDQAVKENKKRRERLLDLMRETALFYVKNLRTDGAKKHRDYLLRRGISMEDAVKFGIGASTDFYSLINHLKGLNYTDQEMILAGVAGEKDKKCYDALGGRLIVPIINQFGQVIAFGGRVLEKVEYGKYKNTKDTPIFSKSNVLYNINNVKKIKNERGLNDLIIVEGYMDAISLATAGITNVVASMGTSLTKDQARIIKRYVGKVYISYDGDSAGQNATIRGLEILKDEGLDVQIITLPDGLDPDDVVKKLGVDAYKQLIYDAKPLIDFKLGALKKQYDLSTSDGKRKFLSKACKIVAESNSPVEQEELLRLLSTLTGVTFDALKREMISASSQEKTLPEVHRADTVDIDDKVVVASRFILYAYLFNKQFARAEDLAELNFYSTAHETIKKYLENKFSKGEKPRFTDLYEVLDEHEELSQIAKMDTEDNANFDKEIYFLDCLTTLKRHALTVKIDLLKAQFSKCENVDERRNITEQMTKLIALKNKLK